MMRRKGFTFIQVAVAALLLGISLIPVIQIFQHSNRAVYKSEGILEASLVAQSIIDEVKTRESLEKFLNKTVTLPATEYPNFVFPEKFLKKLKGSATVNVVVAPNHTIPGRGEKETAILQITVTTFWEESGKKRENTLATYHANLSSSKLNAFNRF